MEKHTFSTYEDKPLYIENDYRNSSCFLILSGPSLASIDLSLLRQPGIVTFGINNSPSVFRPDLWTCVDEPERFLYSIFKDPKIRKFLPIGKKQKLLFDSSIWKLTGDRVCDSPNVVYYSRNDKFQATTFLTEKTVNWGNSKEEGGSRSVMLAAMKIICLLGFKKIFLCGCDFKMELGKQNYAWKQDRSKGSVKCNNSTYQRLIDRFELLKPYLDKAGIEVYNCYNKSGLTTFPFISFEEAVKKAIEHMPDLSKETAEGMYERKRIEEEEKEKLENENKELKYRKKLKDRIKVITPPKKSKATKEKKSDNKRGIIYYNSGTKMLVRLATSISSLRKVYSGNITVFSEGWESSDTCEKIAKHFGVDLEFIDLGRMFKNKVLLNSCLSHIVTPYETTIWLDSDTLVLKDPSELFQEAEDNEFAIAQFSDWTTHKGIISKRIKAWQEICPEKIEKALSFGNAINCGVYSFIKTSSLMKDWYALAEKGKDSFIPDEVACQLMLPEYKHKIMDKGFNESCKHSSIDENTKVIHYHGRKHCRIQNGVLLYNCDRWYKEFDTIRHLSFVDTNILKDPQLKRYLRMYDEKQTSNT